MRRVKQLSARPMVERIRHAIKGDRVTELAGTLARLDAAGDLGDPELFAPPNPARYTRRLIWQDPAGHCVIVGMTWEPGQGSPLHDHDGLWGAEIVVDGLMHEATFRVIATDAHQRIRFRPERNAIVAPRSVGIVIPPLEYHQFRNTGTTTAHTLHVYGGVLRQCSVFREDNDGWWRGQRTDLHYDA